MNDGKSMNMAFAAQSGKQIKQKCDYGCKNERGQGVGCRVRGISKTRGKIKIGKIGRLMGVVVRLCG